MSTDKDESANEEILSTEEVQSLSCPCDFSKTIYKTIRQPNELSLTLLTQKLPKDEKQKSCSGFGNQKFRKPTLGNTPVYQKMSPNSGEKRSVAERLEDKENFGASKCARKKLDYTQALYKKKANMATILELDCMDSGKSPTLRPDPPTLDSKRSQIVSISRRKSRRPQFEQTMFYTCSPEQLSLHKMRCSIYSSLGGSWSIINPEECKRVCFQCFNKTRVESFDDLTPGDHISIHRAAGYEHHAIVIEVLPDENDHTRGVLKVIHRSAHAGELVKGILLCMITVGQYGNLAYLREENVNFDLKKQDVYIIQYKNRPFTRSKIIRRARAELENDITLYSISSDNCEHFANWCATGEYYSHQIGLLKGTLQALLFSDYEGYNRMLNYLAENGLMCDECFKEAKKAQEENRLSSAEPKNNSISDMLP